jgi:hypothetical protein
MHAMEGNIGNRHPSNGFVGMTVTNVTLYYMHYLYIVIQFAIKSLRLGSQKAV